MEKQFKELRKQLLTDGLNATLELEKFKYEAFVNFIEQRNDIDLESVNFKLMMTMQIASITHLELMVEKNKHNP